MRRCTQTQCSYYLQGGCKPCSKCNAEPYNIKEDCERCLSCENVPDMLRWDNGEKDKLTEMLKQLAENIEQDFGIKPEIEIQVMNNGNRP